MLFVYSLYSKLQMYLPGKLRKYWVRNIICRFCYQQNWKYLPQKLQKELLENIIGLIKNIFQRIFGLKSCNLHCNRRKIYPYVACLWSSKRMWWFRWNMSPQFGKRNVSKKHQLFSKEIELSGWYILPLKTDPCAHYWRFIFLPFWQFWSSIWVLDGHHYFLIFSMLLTILINNVGFGWQ